MRLPNYILEWDELRGRWWITDKAGSLYGCLTGYTNEGDALNWIEADRIAPRRKCKQCKRVWVGDLTECPICKETKAVMKHFLNS